jgi:hypothetical protein
MSSVSVFEISISVRVEGAAMPADLRLFADPPEDDSDGSPALDAPGITPGASKIPDVSPPQIPPRSQSSPALKLHLQEPAPPAAEPSVKEDPAGNCSEPETEDDEWLLAALAADEDSAALPRLDPAAAKTARMLPLATYWETHLMPWCHARVDQSAGMTRRTVETFRDHVRAFSQWDALQKPPASWPKSRAWHGWPLAAVASGSAVRQFLRAAVSEGIADRKPWAFSSAKSCLTTLRWILRCAKRQEVVADSPTFDGLLDELRSLAGDPLSVTAYTDAELGAIYAQIPAAVDAAIADRTICKRHAKAIRKRVIREMRAAIVLCANAGPRSEDLFPLRFADHVRLGDGAQVSFVADKTKKRHIIPLSPVTVEQLDRLHRLHGQLFDGELLFPHLTNQKCKRPEDAEARRRATKILRTALGLAGLKNEHFPKPWHAIRKSCRTRFRAIGIAAGLGDVGKLITHGPDADVSSANYLDLSETLTAAVAAMDAREDGWPAEFRNFDDE